MLRKLIERKLDAVERRLGQPIDYLRYMLRVSLRLFFKFSKILSISNCRKKLPADACHVAALVATRDEDCGTCLQIGVNLARQDGVSADLLAAVLQRRVDDLPAALGEVYRFTECVVVEKSDDEALRQSIRERWGEEALVELAMTIAASRVYPVTKRALGYAKSCALVNVQV